MSRLLRRNFLPQNYQIDLFDIRSAFVTPQLCDKGPY